MEIWLKINEFPNYKISSLGRVKNTKTNRILRERNNSNGYNILRLYKKEYNKNILAHRLVAEAFIINPENKPFVNHIDGNKLNNTIFNLEWCTRHENIKHASDNNLFMSGEEHFWCKIKDKEIFKIRVLYFSGKFNQVQLAKKLNISQTHISRIIRFESRKHGS